MSPASAGFNPADAARLLLAAHRGGSRPLQQDVRPPDRTTAFAVQDAVLATLGPVGGWRIMRPLNGPESTRRQWANRRRGNRLVKSTDRKGHIESLCLSAADRETVAVGRLHRVKDPRAVDQVGETGGYCRR